MNNNKKFLKRSVAAFLAALNIFNFAGGSSKALILNESLYDDHSICYSSYFSVMNDNGYKYEDQLKILKSICDSSKFIIKDSKTGKYDFVKPATPGIKVKENVFKYKCNNFSFIYIHLPEPQYDYGAYGLLPEKNYDALLQLVDEAEKTFFDEKDKGKNIKFILYNYDHNVEIQKVISKMALSQAIFVDVAMLKNANSIWYDELIYKNKFIESQACAIQSQKETIKSLKEDLNNLKNTNSKDL